MHVSLGEMLGSKCWRNRGGKKLITEEGNRIKQDNACTMPLPNLKESLNLSKHGAGQKFLYFPFHTLIMKLLLE